jgi:hypothetical protein
MVMANDDHSMISDYNVSIFTPDEILFKGLKFAGLDEAAQKRQPKSNLTKFKDWYGSSPTVLAVIWEDLQTTDIQQALVPPEKWKLEYFFMSHHFLRHYPTKSERKVAWRHVAKGTQTQQEWVWLFVQRITALKSQKIVWSCDHVEGDDIWACTVDGRMF